MSRVHYMCGLLLLMLALMSTCALANQLVNGSFETHTTRGWNVKTPSGGGFSFPTNDAKDGIFSAHFNHGYYDGPSLDNQMWQDLTITPGLYYIKSSGWLKRQCTSKANVVVPDWGFVTVEVYSDGIKQWSQTYLSDNNWYYFDYTSPTPIQINGTESVYIKWGLMPNGRYAYKNVDSMWADGIVLETVEHVPEPAGIAVILTGLAGFTGFTLRRRR